MLHLPLCLFILFCLAACTQKISVEQQYIDSVKPTTTPRIFSKDFITSDSISEYGSVFNKAGDEFYYAVDLVGRAEIRYTKWNGKSWTPPRTILAHQTYSYNDPFYSVDESQLFYISDMPRDEKDTIDDIDIWYSEIQPDGLSDPINAGPQINSDRNEYYISFTAKGTMYFASNITAEVDRLHDFDIYTSDFKEGQFQQPVKVSDAINTRRYEADVYVAPNESYVIFCSARRTGLGKGDLYVSFKQSDDTWTEAVTLGAPVNTEGHELCPFVTADGKYFFYTSNQDLYWVSTDYIQEIRGQLSID